MPQDRRLYVWILMQFVLVAVVSVVVAWLIEVINIPSALRWGIFATLFTLAAGSWGVERLRAALDRRRVHRRERAAVQAGKAGRRRLPRG